MVRLLKTEWNARIYKFRAYKAITYVVFAAYRGMQVAWLEFFMKITFYIVGFVILFRSE